MHLEVSAFSCSRLLRAPEHDGASLQRAARALLAPGTRRYGRFVPRGLLNFFVALERLLGPREVVPLARPGPMGRRWLGWCAGPWCSGWSRARCWASWAAALRGTSTVRSLRDGAGGLGPRCGGLFAPVDSGAWGYGGASAAS